MKSLNAAFTLIELLVVIAIMAILAAMIIPGTAAIKKKRIISKTQTELQQIVSGIERYKIKLGTYPPDNPNNLNVNQLYYELLGTTLNGNTYKTRDGSSTIAASALPTAFGPTVGGFINCTKGAGGDEGTTAQTFLTGLKPNQIADTNGVKILVASVGAAPGPNSKLNPWHYVMTNPTNNARSYDLWVDVMIGGKTNRISNWTQ